MMVIMALVTTFMTGPLLDVINKIIPEKKPHVEDDETKDPCKYRIIISFRYPQRGRTMLRLAYSFIKKAPEKASITALHLSPSSEIHSFNIEEYERDNFQPIIAEARKLNLPVVTLFKPSQDINREITETANIGNFDLLLLGVGRSVFEGSLLGRVLGLTTKIINPERLYDTLTGREKLFDSALFDERTMHILKTVKIPVGVFIDKSPSKLEKVLIPFYSISDSFLLVYAQKLIYNNDSQIIIIDTTGIIQQNPELRETIRSIETSFPNHLALYSKYKMEKEFPKNQDAMLISLDGWKKIIETSNNWISSIPSVLIIKP